MASNAIKCAVFPHKDGWAVAVSSLSRGAIARLVRRRTVTIPHELRGQIRFYVRGERMKWTKTEEAANKWRERFYALEMDEQLAKMGYRTFKVVQKEDCVLTRVQYYRVTRNGKFVTSTYDMRELALYKRGNYDIDKSITKTMQVPKSNYLEWKEQGLFEEVTAKPTGLVGMCREVQDITKRKVKGSDRHPGYRTTTSVNFFKFK